MEEPTKHSNIQDALKSWKAELLDLTGRNQLLYLKNYKSQIELNDLKFFNLENFSKDVDQKLIESEIEINIIDYFEEPVEEQFDETDDEEEASTDTADLDKQLDQLLADMIPDESLRQTIKTKAFNELVDNELADKDINSWTKQTMDVFMTRAEDMFGAMLIDNDMAQTVEEEIVEEVTEEIVEEVTEEIIEEVKPLPENPTPEEIAEFLKKFKDKNDK
tara:strand:+ start:749 stop:1405 length:657 start_codon:yes stop_codon:yes gene_type:complete